MEIVFNPNGGRLEESYWLEAKKLAERVVVTPGPKHFREIAYMPGDWHVVRTENMRDGYVTIYAYAGAPRKFEG